MNKKTKTIALFATIFGLLALAIIYIILKSKFSAVGEGTIGNTAGNLNNKGLFCESDGMIYFSNPYDSNTLYSMTADGKKLKKLCDISAEYINAGGKYVFFFGRPNKTTQGIGSVVSKPGMYRVDKDGDNLKALSKDPSACMLLVGNKIYYQHYTEKTGTTFAVMDLKKQKSTELLNYMVNPACYYQGSLYYNGMTNDHHLYKYDLKTNEELPLWDGQVWDPIFTGEYVYYMDIMNDYRLCRYSFAENTIEILTNDRIDFFNMYADVIYYQVSGSSPALMRMRSNGTEQTTVAQGVYTNINITSDYVYFRPFNADYPIYKTPTFDYPDVTEFTAARDIVMKNAR